MGEFQMVVFIMRYEKSCD